MNLRSILERSGSSFVIIIGIAGSVAVMVSLLARRDTMTATEPAIPIIITNEDPDLSRMDLRFILVTDKTCLIKLILIFP